MQTRTILLWTGLALSSPALGQDVLPLPFTPTTPGPVEGALDLEVETALIEYAHGLDAMVLQGFPVPNATVYDLDLERMDFDFSTVGVYVDGVRADWDPGDLSLWWGSVVGVPGSEVFLALSSLGSYGWVHDGVDRTHLTATPGPDGDWSRAGARVFTDRSLAAAPGGRTGMECLVDELVHGAQRDPAPHSGGGSGGPTATPGMTLKCDIAVETDYQLYQNWGNLAGTQNYVMALLGASSARYLEQVDVALNYPYVQFYTNDQDPWTAQGGGSGAMLDEFRTAWAGKIPGGAHLAHFVSGAGLGGGVAYLDVLCNSGAGFAVSGNINGGVTFPVQQGSNTWDFFVFNHEAGHNFGTPHTHDYCPPLDHCADNCDGFTQCTSSGTIMSYCHGCPGGMSNITTYFHPTVVNLMRSEADASCLPDDDGVRTLWNDGFESGNFKAGAWDKANAKNCLVKVGASRWGTYGGRVRKTAWIERALDTTGYDGVEVFFSWRTKNYDAGEQLVAEWWDGAAYHTIATTSSTSWSDVSFALPAGAADNADFRIRFRSEGSKRNEKGDVDGVWVEATPQ